jgi:hypothetical protein
MNLSNPEARRGLRSIVMAVVVLALLWFLWTWVPRLADADLIEAVRGLLVLLAIPLVGYQMENGLRAFRASFGKDGVKVEADGEQS